MPKLFLFKILTFWLEETLKKDGENCCSQSQLLCLIKQRKKFVITQF